MSLLASEYIYMYIYNSGYVCDTNNSDQVCDTYNSGQDSDTNNSGRSVTSLSEFLKSCDYVVNILPSTPSTRYILDLNVLQTVSW